MHTTLFNCIKFWQPCILFLALQSRASCGGPLHKISVNYTAFCGCGSTWISHSGLNIFVMKCLLFHAQYTCNRVGEENNIKFFSCRLVNSTVLALCSFLQPFYNFIQPSFFRTRCASGWSLWSDGSQQVCEFKMKFFLAHSACWILWWLHTIAKKKLLTYKEVCDSWHFSKNLF